MDCRRLLLASTNQKPEETTIETNNGENTVGILEWVTRGTNSYRRFSHRRAKIEKKKTKKTKFHKTSNENVYIFCKLLQLNSFGVFG